MASEYCWMEPANGCRICMRILSGERARLPGFGLTEGSLVATCGALRLHLDILQLGNGTQNYRDSDGIDRYPGASGPRLHIGFRRRCTMASIQPGLNLRKATFYEGENCGGLQHDLSSSEGRKILGGEFEPLAVLASILKASVPVLLDPHRVIGLNRMDALGGPGRLEEIGREHVR